MRQVRVRSLWVGMLAALVVVLAGCGDDGDKPGPVAGTRTLTVYSSLPMHGTSRRQSQDMVDAMKLALNKAGGQVGELTINFVSLDSADAEDARWTEDDVLDNARQAAKDPNAIAYLGDLDSSATALALPLLNEAGILQVSPSATYLGLTRLGTTRKGEPDRFYPARTRTFGRTVPNDGVQARALVKYMQDNRIRRVYVMQDRGLYGFGLAEQFAKFAEPAGIEILGAKGIDPDQDTFEDEAEDVAKSGAQAFLYGGSTLTNAAKVYNAVATVAPRMMLFSGDATAERSFTSELTPTAQRTMRVTVPGGAPEELPKAGRQFESDFRRRFGRAPEPYAIYAYDAMGVVLQAIRDAGNRGNRRADVVKAFYAIRDRRSVLGTYSIDRAGDTSLTGYAGWKVRNGRLVFDRDLTR